MLSISLASANEIMSGHIHRLILQAISRLNVGTEMRSGPALNEILLSVMILLL